MERPETNHIYQKKIDEAINQFLNEMQPKEISMGGKLSIFQKSIIQSNYTSNGYIHTCYFISFFFGFGL